jgi:hypothetical protein
MSDIHNSGEVPIILPTPVAVTHHRDKWASITKFLSWLTGAFLAMSVFVALISVTSERNDLRKQVDEQTASQVCRAAAGVAVNQAIINEQIAIAKHNVAVGNFIAFISRATANDVGYRDNLAGLADDIENVNGTLSQIGTDLQKAVDQQQQALKDC